MNVSRSPNACLQPRLPRKGTPCVFLFPVLTRHEGRQTGFRQTIRIMGTARSVSGKWDAAFDWSMNEKAVAAGHVRRKPRKKKRRKRKAPERGSPGHRKDGRHKFA